MLAEKRKELWQCFKSHGEISATDLLEEESIQTIPLISPLQP